MTHDQQAQHALRELNAVNVHTALPWVVALAARAVAGHPLLQPAAVSAALQARFAPTFLMGEAVKVTGVLVYNFAAQ